MKLSVSTYRAISAASRISNMQRHQSNGMLDASIEDSPQQQQCSLQSANPAIQVQVEDFSVGDPPQIAEDEIVSEDTVVTGRPASNEPNLLKPSPPDEVSPNSSLPSSPGRLKSNQRWLKLRTTVQLSGALSSATKQKPALKREDSFLKRFSTRQMVESQDTLDDGQSYEGRENGQLVERHRKKRARPPWTVINPDENGYFLWLFLLTLCVLYNLWTLIVRQAFPELQSRAQSLWIGLDAFSDFIYLSDIVMQLRTGYLEQGIMVYDWRKLARHYVYSRPFVLDLVAVTPLDLLQFQLGVWPMLRFPRFVKMYRMRSYYYMVESRTVFPNVWRVANLIHVLLLLAHWFGCFYYLLSEAEQFRGNWAYPYHYHSDFTTLTRKYLGSVYWSTLTLTTIGDLPTPDTNYQRRGFSHMSYANSSANFMPRRNFKSRLTHLHSNAEYLFTIVSYLIGVFIFATIVGQVGNVITNRNANRLEFERLLDSAKLYMRHHHVPRAMQRRVQRWYDYSWSRGHIQGGGDINAALGLLPDKLRTELALHVNLLTLKKVSIFKACQPEFLHDLVLKMRAYIFTPGDLICRKGEVAREMFIIADGILEVISESGKILTTMRSGDFFGEIGILNLDGLNKRTADVRSVGYAELFSLSRENVLSAMRDYPEAQDILQTMGRKRLLEARRASAAAKSKTMTMVSSTVNEADARTSASRRRPDGFTVKNILQREKRVEYDTDSDTGQATALSTPNGETKTENKSRRTSFRYRKKSGGTSNVSSPVAKVGSGEVPTEPLGAGLPLFQRLRMLKDREARTEASAAAAADSQDSTLFEGRDSSGRTGVKPASDRLRSDDSGRTEKTGIAAIASSVVKSSTLSDAPKRFALVAQTLESARKETPTTAKTRFYFPSPVVTSSCTALVPVSVNSTSATEARVRRLRLGTSQSEDFPDATTPTGGSSISGTAFSSSRQHQLRRGSSETHCASEPTPRCSFSSQQSSPDLTETTQRRGLRSILRRMGGSEEASPAAGLDTPPAVQDYLMRKKNLVKSVSFNSPSSPGSSSEVVEAGAASAAVASPSSPMERVAGGQALPDVTSQLPLARRTSQEANCAVLVAEIRDLLQLKLTEIHESLTARIESLEFEMKERDHILQDICNRQQSQEVFHRTVSSPDSNSDETCFAKSDSVDSVVRHGDVSRQWSRCSDQDSTRSGHHRSRHRSTTPSQDELWKFEFPEQAEDAESGVESSDHDLPPSGDEMELNSSQRGDTNDWEVQMLVAEMDRTEKRERRRLVADLSYSEVELLRRLQPPARQVRGGSIDVTQMTRSTSSSSAPPPRLSRISSLREASRSLRGASRRREIVATVCSADQSEEGGLHMPLLSRQRTSREGSPVTKLRSSDATSRETAAL